MGRENYPMARSSRLTLVIAFLFMALIAAGIAGASSGKPRFYSKYPKLDLARFELTVDTGGYTHADCSLHDGNQGSGWRQIRCVGKVDESGVAYRFKLVTTPQSCSRLGEVFTIPGVGSRKKTVIWPHYFFSCRR
jgi:hypothetical protein